MKEKTGSVRVSFNTKILVPVIATIVLLVAFSLWILNARITRQLHRDATQNLLTAQKIFERLEDIGERHLVARAATVPNEPRFRAIAQLAEPNTIRFHLRELINELDLDFVAYSNPSGEVISEATRDPLMTFSPGAGFGTNAARRALAGDPVGDVGHVDGRVFRIASVPIALNDEIIGVLTMAEEFNETIASEFVSLTGCDVVLLVNDRPVLSTLRNFRLSTSPRFLEAVQREDGPGGASRWVDHSEVGGESSLLLTRPFRTLDADADIGYALILSYEETLGTLRNLQGLLLGAGFLGVLASSGVIWFVVGRTTSPLRILRDNAEAVGRGDFTRKVPVMSSDEFGDLAKTFNQMTDNLQESREELEATFEKLKSTRAQLVQSEKLSVLGEFIAGVAHELNNPLCAIVGFSEVLRTIPPGEQFERDLNHITESAERCHKIIQNLLSFARQRVPERKAVQLNSVLDATLNFMSYELRTNNVAVVRELHEPLPPVMADAHQLQQVFLNIINNARQAMEGTGGNGQIHIRTGEEEGRVRIEIADNGPGMAPEVAAKVFDPFFTTKEAGKGTGLGLSVSYGIIREHGGEIVVQSTPGEGTRFQIHLPATDTANAEQLTEGASADDLPLPGEGRRVLVVDDEQPVLDLITNILENDGFVVESVLDGKAGLRRLRRAHFDLVVCDWRLPETSGRELYETLRSFDPGVAARLIFMTGDVLSHQTTDYLRDCGKECLTKPFSLAEFRSAIKKVTASSPGFRSK